MNGAAQADDLLTGQLVLGLLASLESRQIRSDVGPQRMHLGANGGKIRLGRHLGAHVAELRAHLAKQS